jgi:hypothetical protein
MIRAAFVEDRGRVVELLRDSRIGAGFDRADGPSGFCFPFVEADAELLFLNYVDYPQRLCLVHDVGGVAQGILMAHAFKHDYGPVLLSQERVWWIDPAHRGTAAMRMLDAYEAWSRDQGCVFAGMAGMGNDPAVAVLYRRRGYLAAETHFLKAL